MTYVIYDKRTTQIMGKVRMGKMQPDHRKTYKTHSAAQAALTRAQNQWWDLLGRTGKESDDQDPRFRYAIAELGWFCDFVSCLVPLFQLQVQYFLYLVAHPIVSL